VVIQPLIPVMMGNRYEFMRKVRRYPLQNNEGLAHNKRLIIIKAPSVDGMYYNPCVRKPGRPTAQNACLRAMGMNYINIIFFDKAINFKQSQEILERVNLSLQVSGFS